MQHWVTGHEDGTGETIQRYTLALSAVFKSHSHYCPVPEHTRTAMCTSLFVNPFLPLHSLGQPSPVSEGVHTCTQHRWIQRGSSWRSWCLSRWCTMNSLEKTHDIMGKDRNRNPASAQTANSFQTALESCPVSSALRSPFGKPHPTSSSCPIQCSCCTFCLQMPVGWSQCERCSPIRSCAQGWTCRVHHCTEPPLTPSHYWLWAGAGLWCFPAAQLPLVAAQCQKN